jgi:hypothetical protein
LSFSISCGALNDSGLRNSYLNRSSRACGKCGKAPKPNRVGFSSAYPPVENLWKRYGVVNMVFILI